MKKFIYTNDDLLKFLLRQIKFIDVDAEESGTDEIVSATIIYRNGGKTNCRLPRKLIDYLSDRINDLFHKHNRRIIGQLKEKNRMKKYTDTELLNVLLPMLNFSTNIYEVHSNPVKFQILRGPSCSSERDFIIALQNRIDEITKMADVRVTDQGADDCEETEDIDSNDNEVMKDEECQDNDADSMCCDCVEATYSSKEYYDLKKECIEKDHEIWKLKRTVEALEYLIYNCIPKDDRRDD